MKQQELGSLWTELNQVSYSMRVACNRSVTLEAELRTEASSHQLLQAKTSMWTFEVQSARNETQNLKLKLKLEG